MQVACWLVFRCDNQSNQRPNCGPVETGPTQVSQVWFLRMCDYHRSAIWYKKIPALFGNGLREAYLCAHYLYQELPAACPHNQQSCPPSQTEIVMQVTQISCPHTKHTSLNVMFAFVCGREPEISTKT